MTIEIKQLVIRAVVERKQEGGAPNRAPQLHPIKEPPRRQMPATARASLDREALVADVARLVLRELRKERER